MNDKSLLCVCVRVSPNCSIMLVLTVDVYCMPVCSIRDFMLSFELVCSLLEMGSPVESRSSHLATTPVNSPMLQRYVYTLSVTNNLFILCQLIDNSIL